MTPAKIEELRELRAMWEAAPDGSDEKGLLGFRLMDEAFEALPHFLAAASQGDERCPQVAGRCEKPLGHEGAHYTTFGGDDEPTWRWSLAADVTQGAAAASQGDECRTEDHVGQITQLGEMVDAARKASQGDEGLRAAARDAVAVLAEIDPPSGYRAKRWRVALDALRAALAEEERG